MYNSAFEQLVQFREILSPREIQILQLLARGFNSNDIANALRVSHHTVNTHRRNMLRKLEAANTPEMLTLARDMNLV